MYYLIKDSLVETSKEAIPSADAQYVAILTAGEWAEEKECFNMGIDIEPDLADARTTKAEVNYDSLTGSFYIPDRQHLPEGGKSFCFALDEQGIVFIDDSGTAAGLIGEIRRTKKWRFPSLERFLYDFLEQIVRYDRAILEKYEDELDAMETAILREEEGVTMERANTIRSEIRDMRIHYEQLLDFGQELEENENDFFKPENLRYFRLFSSRIERLRDSTAAISDHASQIRDIYKSNLDIKQNRIMTVLTIVTTVFMPLTVIAGWYGMNFRYMPELDSVWGYPVVIGVSVLIVVLSLLYFKKKKWL